MFILIFNTLDLLIAIFSENTSLTVQAIKFIDNVDKRTS
jgi:hypothetical protein